MDINWESIEGYSADMTAEQKLALLDNYEMPKADTDPAPKPEVDEPKKPVDKTISKAAYDKVASELASVKKQLRSRMSESEQLEEQRKEQDESLRLELEALRKEKTIASHRAALLGHGYDAKLADEAATALADGDMDNFFITMGKQAKLTESALRAQFLKDTPVPPAGEDLTKEQREKQEEEKFRKYFGL